METDDELRIPKVTTAKATMCRPQSRIIFSNREGDGSREEVGQQKPSTDALVQVKYRENLQGPVNESRTSEDAANAASSSRKWTTRGTTCRRNEVQGRQRQDLRRATAKWRTSEGRSCRWRCAPGNEGSGRSRHAEESKGSGVSDANSVGIGCAQLCADHEYGHVANEKRRKTFCADFTRRLQELLKATAGAVGRLPAESCGRSATRRTQMVRKPLAER